MAEAAIRKPDLRIDQISARLHSLGDAGVVGAPATPDLLAEVESRVGLALPQPVRAFWQAFDGIEVVDPPFQIHQLANLTYSGSLLTFCRCNHEHSLAFRTVVNEAGEWSIVNAETAFTVTMTMASFAVTRMWSWLLQRRPIWQEEDRAS